MPNPASPNFDPNDILAVDAAVARSTGSTQFGVTADGFVAKPFARVLAEKLALARALFGDDLDLTSGSVVRKIFEVSALEDARTWAALASMYDNSFVVSATGEALSRLGEELGLARPFLQAGGKIGLKLKPPLPPGVTRIDIPRGARLLTPGGHHAATDESVSLSADSPERDVAALAFFPGPENNLDPAFRAPDGSFPQKIDRWNPVDDKNALVARADAAGTPLVTIEHTAKFTGGELQWPDARYRQLLLQAPRSVWTVEAVQIAASLTPGVRQAQVRDGFGGLDIDQSIFGNFNFIERLFSSERDLGNPYFFTVLIAPAPAAILDGPDGVLAAVQSAIEDLRPIGIFPRVVPAEEVGVGVAADLVAQGIPLPAGSRATINSSQAAIALKQRIMLRLERYIDSLKFGEPVRSAEVVWAIMNEPGIADARNVRLLRFPRSFDQIHFEGPGPITDLETLDLGANAELQVNQIAVFVDDPSHLEIT